MTESEVLAVASNFVVEQRWDPCQIVSVRRFVREQIPDPETVGDEWVVQVQFESEDEGSVDFGMIIVDDATEIARPFECL